MRSTGRKDRHSKVCTAKGPRDRRVRLAAHTAIQFYDVQDRLGYDRPSKAVDWLIKKAKAAIDELDELPTWNPISAAAAAQSAAAATTVSASLAGDGGLNLQSQMMEQQHQQNDNSNINNNGNTSSGFLPPSLDSDAIADTIKSFFPIASEEQQHHNHNQDHQSHHPRVSSSSSIQFYAPDLLSRTSTGQSQDLQLSLQSFQDPILLNHHQQQAQVQAQQAHHNEHGFFSGFGWSDHHHHQNPAEISRFQRIMFNNNGGNNGGGGGDGGFVFNSPPLFSRGGENNNNHHHHNNNNNNQFFSFQRGPLQSSNTPSVRAWIDHTSSSSSSSPLMVMSSIADHQIPHSLPGMGFIPSVGGGGFSSGFHHNIPARIQGEEEHDGISDKPSSASSDSCH